MTHDFYDLVIGGVMFAPFVTYAVTALVVIVLLRPGLHLIGFAKAFSHVSIAEFSLYVSILGALILLS